jgi:hypothetical protein
VRRPSIPADCESPFTSGYDKWRARQQVELEALRAGLVIGQRIGTVQEIRS